jgi:hypothetical protein
MVVSDLVAKQLSNQLVGGGLVLMASGSLIALCRQVPSNIYHWIKRRVTVDVEVLNSDPLFDYVTVWLDRQPYAKKSRRLTATTINRMAKVEAESPVPGSGKKRQNKPRLFLSPAPGTHFFWYNGRLLKLYRNRENSPSQSGTTQVSFAKSETYTITLFGRNQSIIRGVVQEILDAGDTDEDVVRVFTSGFGYWKSSGVMCPRSIDTVVLPVGVVEDVLSDVEEFLKSRQWYKELGIPWHRGYLFHGVPGSGKTSLVSAVAGHLRMDVYLLNIGATGMDDERLASLMEDVQPGSIVLMEDVDCTIPGRESKETRRVTLSGLLNVLDGIQATEGCMIFMTTNFRSKLDDALTRPGRIDYEMEFGYATEDQAVRLRDRICPGSPLPDWQGKTMADIQQKLIGISNGQSLRQPKDSRLAAQAQDAVAACCDL